MDLATAQTNLDNWLAADAALSAGQSYTIGNRQLSRSDAGQVRNQITYWQRIVKTFTASNAGSQNPGVVVAAWK